LDNPRVRRYFLESTENVTSGPRTVQKSQRNSDVRHRISLGRMS
jgi:hypothetical protein